MTVSRESSNSRSTSLLQVKNLVKDFAGYRAVDGVTLNVREGSVHALIGPNGAGKTTCFNLITRFLSPTSGSIVFKGEDITARRPSDIARMGIVRSFQICAIFSRMSVLENVRISLQRKHGSHFSFWRSESSLEKLNGQAHELIQAVGLGSLATCEASQLSYGSKRALELATTLALDPELLLLDEPFAGLGREDIERIAGLIKNISEDHTVLMVDHNISVVAELCDTISVLARGQVVCEGDYQTVSNDRRVIDAYLGEVH